mmetsp:Transcript_29686/g.58844  ORF Transcript_29686/g.58844 Transcript_29686/m.58844 type:complete len:217 (-) Transcript_29686:749-1399(-)
MNAPPLTPLRAPRPTGKPTCRAASSGWRSSMAVRPLAMPRRGLLCGPSPIRCLSTASLCTPTAETLWRITPPTRTVTPTACRRCMRRSKSKTSRRTIQSSSPPAAWSNMRAAATRHGRTRGWPSCNRTCSSRSTRGTPTTLVCVMARRSGSKGPKAARSRLWRWSPTGSVPALPLCLSTLGGISRVKIRGPNTLTGRTLMCLVNPPTRPRPMAMIQ